MQEVFEKILEKLKEKKNCNPSMMFEADCWRKGIDEAIEIVKNVAEEFATDTNVGTNGWIPCSGCADCQHKECEHCGKV